MPVIMVGVDLSPGSERAVAHAVGIARHLGWDVTLVLVDAVPDPAAALPAAMRGIAERYARSLGARLEEHRAQLAALRERFTGRGVELSQLVVDGLADERLPAVATELDAAAIVVGSHGRTGLARLLIGSVAERVARRAEVDVLVARGDAPDGGYRRVLVATDFSAQADHAFRHALPWVARDGQLELVHAWQLPVAGLGLEPAIGLAYDELQAGLEGALRETAERLRDALAARPDVRLSYRAMPGPPAHGVTELAAHRHADLIVVGSHGRRGFRRFVLGSVAEVVVRHAPCSVLVAR